MIARLPRVARAAAAALVLASCGPLHARMGGEPPPPGVVETRSQRFTPPPGFAADPRWLVDLDGALVLWNDDGAWRLEPGANPEPVALVLDERAGERDPALGVLRPVLQRMMPPQGARWHVWLRRGDEVLDIAWDRDVTTVEALSHRETLVHIGGLTYRVHLPEGSGRVGFERFDGRVTTPRPPLRFAAGYVFPFGRDRTCAVEDSWSATVRDDGTARQDVALRCDGRRVVVPSRGCRLLGPEVGFDDSLAFLLAGDEGEDWIWWSVSEP